MSESHQIVVSSSDTNNVSAEPEIITESSATKIQTPKRTPSKRMSFVERAQAESEQLLKSMGIDIEGTTPGRRTRSGGARSSPVVPVESPAKRPRTTPKKGKGRGKKLLDSINIEKIEEVVPENSIDTTQEPSQVNHEVKEKGDQNDGFDVDVKIEKIIPEETKEEEIVQKTEQASNVVEVPEEKNLQQEPTETITMDVVDSSSTKILSTPSVAGSDASLVVEKATETEEASTESAQQSVEINAAQENELNTAEEIKQNEIINSVSVSEDSKFVVKSEVSSSSLSEAAITIDNDSNNHSPIHPEQEQNKDSSSGNCQTETEPPAANNNSDIVQTPQSCN